MGSAWGGQAGRQTVTLTRTRGPCVQTSCHRRNRTRLPLRTPAAQPGLVTSMSPALRVHFNLAPPNSDVELEARPPSLIFHQPPPLSGLLNNPFSEKTSVIQTSRSSYRLTRNSKWRQAGRSSRVQPRRSIEQTPLQAQPWASHRPGPPAPSRK